MPLIARRLHVLLTASLLVAASAAWGGGSVREVTLCHRPPGNPDGARTIAVGRTAADAHLAHGDSLGECPSRCEGGVAAPVPKTGQTECWDESGSTIDCAGTGFDGELQLGVSVSPRFTNNGDGTVKDNLTGLIWLKDTSCRTLPWRAAVSAANTLANGACGLTDGSAPGDWRLPNIEELHSLIAFSQIFPALPPGHPFTGVPDPFYVWSSTTVASFPTVAWMVDFGLGVTTHVAKANTGYVWAVRGRP